MFDSETQFVPHFDAMLRPTFKKAEHLYLRSDIDALFSAGSKSVNIFPIRAVYRLEKGESEYKVKVMVSVSKRRLRHAVDRNRSKRQMREAYRLQKQILWDAIPDGYHLSLGLIWLPSQLMDSQSIHQTVQKLLLRIGENVTKAFPDLQED